MDLYALLTIPGNPQIPRSCWGRRRSASQTLCPGVLKQKAGAGAGAGAGTGAGTGTGVVAGAGAGAGAGTGAGAGGDQSFLFPAGGLFLQLFISQCLV